MNPVTIIKVECPKHRGCYFLGPCTICAVEKIRADFERELQAICALAVAR